MNYFRRRALMTKLATSEKRKPKIIRNSYDLVPMGASVKGPDGKNYKKVVRGDNANNQRKQFVRDAIGGEKRLHQVKPGLYGTNVPYNQSKKKTPTPKSRKIDDGPSWKQVDPKKPKTKPGSTARPGRLPGSFPNSRGSRTTAKPGRLPGLFPNSRGSRPPKSRIQMSPRQPGATSRRGGGGSLPAHLRERYRKQVAINQARRKYMRQNKGKLDAKVMADFARQKRETRNITAKNYKNQGSKKPPITFFK